MDKILQILRLLTEPSLENLRRVVDILLVAFLIYQFLRLVRGTQAWRILGGLVLFFVVLGFSSVFQLTTLHWLLDKATLLGPVALVILFLPQLRQALERVPSLFPQIAPAAPTTVTTIEEIIGAVAELAKDHTGALIVIERTASLDAVAETGVTLEAKVSSPVLMSIFFGRNALHDGAAVIRGDRIVAAACQLPLAENSRLDRNVHMRHRAAVGASEAYDCVAIAVSEERGTISVAENGQLTRLSNLTQLREALMALLRDEKPVKPEKTKRTKVKPAPLPTVEEQETMRQ